MAKAWRGWRVAAAQAAGAVRRRRLAWLGLALGLSFWLLESGLHALVFDPIRFWFALLGEGDPNEIWMRIVTTLLLVVLGAALDRLGRSERQARQRAARLGQISSVVTSASSELREGQTTVVEQFADLGVLFADIVGFTEMAGRVSPVDLVELLRDLFGRFDVIAEQRRIEKIKTIGDAYIAVSGTPGSSTAAALARAALDMRRATGELLRPDGAPVGIRIGLAAGSAVAGVVAQKKFGYDVWGDAVNLASRVESACEPGDILVTDALRNALGGDFVFDGRRDVDLKGKGVVTLWSLVGEAVAATRARGLAKVLP